MSRIAATFDKLRANNETAFVAFLMAGDPSEEISTNLINALPAAGVDIIEIGMPFTDPMADGPTIQLAGQRALEAGMTLNKTLKIVENFRATNQNTPIVLMGYYNPVAQMGVENFLKRAKNIGVDGLIIVDLPPEEDEELCLPAIEQGLDFIRLTTPTTNDKRLSTVVKNSSGFVYYVSITGITGAASANADMVKPEVERIRKASGLPVCVGFGVKTAESAKDIASVADGVVVGSAIVKLIEEKRTESEILQFVSELSQATKSV